MTRPTYESQADRVSEEAVVGWAEIKVPSSGKTQ